MYTGDRVHCENVPEYCVAVDDVDRVQIERQETCTCHTKSMLSQVLHGQYTFHGMMGRDVDGELSFTNRTYRNSCFGVTSTRNGKYVRLFRVRNEVYEEKGYMQVSGRAGCADQYHRTPSSDLVPQHGLLLYMLTPNPCSSATGTVLRRVRVLAGTRVRTARRTLVPSGAGASGEGAEGQYHHWCICRQKAIIPIPPSMDTAQTLNFGTLGGGDVILGALLLDQRLEKYGRPLIVCELCFDRFGL